MLKNLKDSFFQSEPDPPETIYGNDIRALVLAHKLNSRMVNIEANAQIKGIFSYYYRKMAPVRTAMLVIILAIILFQKPAWCIRMGDAIDETCSVDVEGRTYNLTITTFIEPRTSFVFTFGLMYALLTIQIIKVLSSKIVFTIEKVKLTLQTSFFVLGLITSLMQAFNFMAVNDLPNIFKLLFVIISFKSMMYSFAKIGKMLATSSQILMLLFVVLFIFSLMARVMFEGLDIGAENTLQGYCFTSFIASLESMFQIMFYESYPDVVVEAGLSSPFYVVFFVLFSVITSVMLLAMTTGVFYFNYKGIFTKNLNYVAQKYPDFVSKIQVAMRAKFLKPEIADSLTKKFETRLKEPEVNEIPESQAIRASYMSKLRRAVMKIKYLNSFKKPVTSNSFKTRYIMISESFYYRAICIGLALYICYLPMVLIDPDNSRNYIGNLQMSELFAVIFLIDFLLKLSYNNKMVFWNFTNTIECISNVGIIFTSHILYLIPADFSSSELIGSRGVFLLWSVFCLMKSIKIQQLLMSSTIKYKIIVKTILHIFPLLFDLLTCYAVILIFYSLISYSILGGVINSDFGGYYKEVTGNNFNSNFNFNDIFNSLLSFATTNIASSFMANFGPGIVASMAVSQGGFFQFMVRIFFYSYVIISELIVINIIVGFIIDFLNIYQDNNAPRRIKEQVINKKQDFVDVMLDKKDFGEINPEDFDEEGNPVNRPDLAKNENIRDDYAEASDLYSNDFESQHSFAEPEAA